jgi:hypothetical protein
LPIVTTSSPVAASRKSWLTLYRRAAAGPGRSADHRLGADRQRPGEHVEPLDAGLEVHQPLPGLVVGLLQVALVLDARDPDPGSAVVRLHVERVADLVRDLAQVEGPVVLRRGVAV